MDSPTGTRQNRTPFEALGSRTLTKTLLIAALAALVCKILLTLATYGTNDVLFWEADLRKVEAEGGIALYRDGAVPAWNGKTYRIEAFNQPPFLIHLLKAWKVLSDNSGLPPIRFWLRLTSSVADFGMLWILCRILEAEKLAVTQLNLILFALSPVSILVSGFHGNTDPVMILFVMIAVYLISAGRPILLAGLAFGMALNIKVAAVIFLPAVLLYLGSWRRRAVFCSCVGIAFFAGSIPEIIQDPALVVHKVFGYLPVPGDWGFNLVARRISAGLRETYPRIGRPLALASVVIASIWIHRRHPYVPLFVRCGLGAFTFLFFTPGFGSQYLIWVLPWWVILEGWDASVFYASSAAFLLLLYGAWSQFTFYLGNSLEPVARNPRILATIPEAICWLSIGALAIRIAQWKSDGGSTSLGPITVCNTPNTTPPAPNHICGHNALRFPRQIPQDRSAATED